MFVATAGRRSRQDLNGALTTFMVAGHVAHRILPIIGTASQDFQITKINQGDTLRIIRTKRAPKARAARVETPIDYTTGHCEERAAEEPCDVTVLARIGSQVDGRKVAAKTAATVVANDLEDDVIGTFFNETNYPLSGTTGLDTSNRWTDPINATPIADVNVVVDYLRKQGTPGNGMLINQARARDVWNCDRIRARLTQIYGRVIPGEPVAADLAAIFGIDEVIIASAMKNTANPGATNAFDYIASGKYCGVFRKSADQTFTDPRVGNIFVWTNAYAESQADILPIPEQMPDNVMEFARCEEYDEPGNSSIVVSVKTFTDELLLNSTAFKLIKIADA